MDVSSQSKWGGTILMIVGVLFIVVNTILAPLMPVELEFPGTMASPEFLNRLSAAIFLMFFLSLGTYYLYTHLPTASKAVDRTCFGIAFLGNVFLFAHEWAQVFYVYPMANVAPQGLIAVENMEGFNLYDCLLYTSPSPRDA